MALAPWNVLAGGKIRTDEEEERRRQTGEKGEHNHSTSQSVSELNSTLNCSGRQSWGDWERTPEQRKMCLALEEVAKQVGAKNIQAGQCPFDGSSGFKLMYI